MNNAPEKPLSEREVRRGLRVNIFAGSLGMAFVAVASGVPITMGNSRCVPVCSRRITTGVLAGTSTRTPTSSMGTTSPTIAVAVARRPHQGE